ncbi:MAG TPA: bifunctional methylenetetrahydrofolate dehydrogenase/methenyltetrahydrofolate cyclohydrolase FolD [Ignavibacteria bacterium]|nr:bifunctional methylenetetrahydrofolate dehydrogenase/methenyltetrahydrofolate cyclohydrolase FolD [Ignavibacteria bacterium]HRA99717.1 bifunctional methylenetetrahydrofolate dehydrogenase/methenyltetrahydrofolate cyclohydrolase FolD [Ignavibacteria bacterium]
MELNKLIDGKNISAQIRDEIKTETEILKKEKGIIPGLAFIIAGEDPASKVYVKNKGKACEEAGFHSVTEVLPEGITEIQLLELIWKYNTDENIHGILTQLPLPLHIDPQRVIEAIDPKKDVDGFHPVNVGKLSIGEKCFIPCTPYGIIEMLRRENIETSGKHAVILGRSNIVGKPVASLLLGKDMNSTVTVCHSRTTDIKKITSQADILIAAMGRADFVKKDFIKDGAVIIDVGINRVEDENKKSGYRITGDVDFEDCIEKCSKITPVPGGVGPMTIAMLLRNTLDSAKGEIYG